MHWKCTSSRKQESQSLPPTFHLSKQQSLNVVWSASKLSGELLHLGHRKACSRLLYWLVPSCFITRKHGCLSYISCTRCFIFTCKADRPMQINSESHLCILQEILLSSIRASVPVKELRLLQGPTFIVREPACEQTVNLRMQLKCKQVWSKRKRIDRTAAGIPTSKPLPSMVLNRLQAQILKSHDQNYSNWDQNLAKSCFHCLEDDKCSANVFPLRGNSSPGRDSDGHCILYSHNVMPPQMHLATFSNSILSTSCLAGKCVADVVGYSSTSTCSWCWFDSVNLLLFLPGSASNQFVRVAAGSLNFYPTWTFECAQ